MAEPSQRFRQVIKQANLSEKPYRFHHGFLLRAHRRSFLCSVYRIPYFLSTRNTATRVNSVSVSKSKVDSTSKTEFSTETQLVYRILFVQKSSLRFGYAAWISSSGSGNTYALESVQDMANKTQNKEQKIWEDPSLYRQKSYYTSEEALQGRWTDFQMVCHS